jgi:hypothetical protein
MSVAISPIATRNEIEEDMSEASLIGRTAFHWIVGCSRHVDGAFMCHPNQKPALFLRLSLVRFDEMRPRATLD